MFRACFNKRIFFSRFCVFVSCVSVLEDGVIESYFVIIKRSRKGFLYVRVLGLVGFFFGFVAVVLLSFKICLDLFCCFIC